MMNSHLHYTSSGSPLPSTSHDYGTASRWNSAVPNTNDLAQKAKVLLYPFYDVMPGTELHSIVRKPDFLVPLVYFLIEASSIFFNGSIYQVSRLYQVMLTGCVVMYLILDSGTNRGPSLLTVASSMGDCLLPILIVTLISRLLRLGYAISFFFSMMATAWSTLSATRILGLQADIRNKYSLVVYPCTIIYGIISIMAIM